MHADGLLLKFAPPLSQALQISLVQKLHAPTNGHLAELRTCAALCAMQPLFHLAQSS